MSRPRASWPAPPGVVGLLCTGAVLAAVGLARSDAGALDFVLGERNPVLIAVAACLLGLAGMSVLVRVGWIAYRAERRQSYFVAALLGGVLSLPAVLLDLWGGFPEDMNVPAPEAYFAYPAIALVAEFGFHVLPLATVAVVTGLRSGPGGGAHRTGLAVAAVLEPLLQVAWGVGRSPLWTNVIVGPHLFLFNVVGLHLLRRHGFLAAYTLRLAYYAVWHVVWGQLRLPILFGG